MWEGLDGTEVFTYFLTAQTHEEYKDGIIYATYNGDATPQLNLGTWERFQQKYYGNETIVTYGFGDGGGTTDEMIEMERRLEYGIPGMPKAQMSFVGDFLERAESNFRKNCENNGRTPKWVGELYLEFHRGTYTSIAKNKKNNRECEFLCQEAESLSIIDNVLFGKVYPTKMFNTTWKKILLNQFHDIVPGSSILEVYKRSDKDYEEIRANLGDIKENCIRNFSDNVSENGIFVYNPNSFEVSDYVQLGSETIYAENIPPMGWKVISDGSDNSKITVGDKIIESPHYIIKFNGNMNIISLFDKDNGVECVKNGCELNRLCAFEDYPYDWDNWEITNYYKQKKWDIDNVTEVRAISGNGYGGYKIKRRYMNSDICQRINVYGKSRRIDVENNIDWHENHILLKAMFPVNIHSNKATYEIQFGNVERNTHENTSWDAAKFEVCAHKWADLSEDGYGISILNNCKYGHSVLGDEMTLTLIKCGTYPNPEADQGKHIFTYSIYPHSDDFKRGGTVFEGYKLNRPMTAVKTSGGGTLKSEYSLVACDCDNIIIETVKQAENGNGVIIRLYDAWNRKSKPTIKLGFDVKKVSVCNMLEEPQEEISNCNRFNVNVGNFEIVTLLAEI